MAKRIIKKIGSDRIGSGKKMTVQAHGYGYSTHDVSQNFINSQGFGTIVPQGTWLMPAGSRLRLEIDAMVTSAALFYQLYGSAKIQWDVFEARMALYNPMMMINLMDAGYTVADVKFPLMELETKGFTDDNNMTVQQVNPSSLLYTLGVVANGQNELNAANPVTRKHMAMWLLMYYQTVKEYYANKQEGIGYIIHNSGVIIKTVTDVSAINQGGNIPEAPATNPITMVSGQEVEISWIDQEPNIKDIIFNIDSNQLTPDQIFDTIIYDPGNIQLKDIKSLYIGTDLISWEYGEEPPSNKPRLVEYDLKAIDRMTMDLMANIKTATTTIINKDTELPYGASFRVNSGIYAINTTQEGLAVGTYNSDLNNNWLDNAKINALTSRTKVKVNEEGEFSIDQLNIIQKFYNIDMRIAVTDGTLDEWREMVYAVSSNSKSLKPVYAGGASKEIIFNMVVSTAGTEEEPLASIASRGQLGQRNKGGYAQIDAATEEKLVMVLCKITPRIVYTQGNDFTTNLKTLDDLHKPGLDKISYENRITDQVFAPDTVVKADGTLITKSLGKLPAWSNYRSKLDRAGGFMANQENYKVFGREYEGEKVGTNYQLKDGTTYIDPTKYNDVFADSSLEAMPFDVVTEIKATMTMVMSEEVIPGI